MGLPSRECDPKILFVKSVDFNNGIFLLITWDAPHRSGRWISSFSLLFIRTSQTQS